MAVGSTDQIARLLHGARIADGKQVAGIRERNLHLELIAREAAVGTGTFDGQVPAVVADANAHRAMVRSADISLGDT